MTPEKAGEKIFHHEYLLKFSRDILHAAGFSDENGLLAARVLIEADLRGIDSHGVARIPGYLRLLKAGRANPNPRIQLVHETPGTGLIDGDKGLGLNVGPKAMEIAIKKARHTGTGWVAVKNSNHFGIAAYHAMKALEHNMIGIAMTNASPIVSPTFSKSRLLGTNPICFVAPAKQEPPFVMDMSTTTAANGKLEILQRAGKETPHGWVQDKDGNEAIDPFILGEGGALLPLGSDRVHSSHKGYCLGSMVDILCGVLPGANYGPWVPPFVAFLNPSNNPVGEGIGHFFGAIRIDAFRPAEEFKDHMDNWIRTFRNAKTVAGEAKVIIPGDPEREIAEIRRREGIPLQEKVVTSLKNAAKELKLSFHG